MEGIPETFWLSCDTCIILMAIGHYHLSFYHKCVKSFFKTPLQLLDGSKGILFDTCHYLDLYFVCVIRVSSDETVQMRKLV